MSEPPPSVCLIILQLSLRPIILYLIQKHSPRPRSHSESSNNGHHHHTLSFHPLLGLPSQSDPDFSQAESW
jgi:hypothetical protein